MAKKEETAVVKVDKNAVAKADKIVLHEEKRSLKVDLTHDEIFAAGQKAADAQNTVTELNSQLKSVTSSIKGQKDIAEAELSRHATLVRQKYDFRQVPCRTTKNYTKGTVVTVRLDTMEELERRNMTDAELSNLPII
jgi:DUF4097 and DUF4098 domain-containing protein YvlB